jgi:hypothetical protein
MEVNSKDIYDRIYQVLKCTSDTDMAEKLGMSAGNMPYYKNPENKTLKLLEKLMDREDCTDQMIRFVLLGEIANKESLDIYEFEKLRSQIEILQDTLLKSKK